MNAGLSTTFYIPPKLLPRSQFERLNDLAGKVCRDGVSGRLKDNRGDSISPTPKLTAASVPRLSHAQNLGAPPIRPILFQKDQAECR